jgi:hypothetical protein
MPPSMDVTHRTGHPGHSPVTSPVPTRPQPTLAATSTDGADITGWVMPNISVNLVLSMACSWRSRRAGAPAENE